MIGCLSRGVTRFLITRIYTLTNLIYAFTPFNQRQRRMIQQSPTHQNTTPKPKSKLFSHQEISIEAWKKQLAKAASLEDLIRLSDESLKQSGAHLAFFLRRLHPYINQKALQQHKAFFQAMNSGVNSLADTLNLTGGEFIEILRFRGKMRRLKGEMNFMHNYGMEKKASMLAATFIHNREISFSQAVLALNIVLSLGGANLLLLINFLKYFKETAEGQNKNCIKLEHLLCILSAKFNKRNQIIIENTMYDHILYFMLENMSGLLQGQSITLKIETLRVLLLFDGKHNYRTNPTSKRYWTRRLLSEVEGYLTGSWAAGLWKKQQSNEKEAVAAQVVYLLQCMAFAQTNMINFQGLTHAFTTFSVRAYQQFEKECEQMQYQNLKNEERIEAFMRFIFNPLICVQWIARKHSRELIFAAIMKETVQEERVVEALVSLMNSDVEYEIRIRLVELAKAFLDRHLQAGIILPSLTLTFIQKASPDIAHSLLLTIRNRIKDADIWLFNDFAGRCLGYAQQAIVLQMQPSKIHSEKGPGHLVRQIFSLISASRSKAGYQAALDLLQENFQTIRSLLWDAETKRSQMNPLLSQESFYIGWIVFANLANGRTPNQPLQDFFSHLISSDVVKFELLSRCYQSYPQLEHRRRQNVIWGQSYDSLKFLGECFNQDKYSYFVWDAQLKRLPSLPSKLREECIPLVETTFLRAYRKQNLRKVVMNTVLSAYIAAGVIVGPRNKLQALFETAADELFQSEERIQYHYNCYLMMVSNALAADILSPLYFDKIMLHSLRKYPKMRQTCSLMLLYGGSFTSRNEKGGVIEPQVVREQATYLRFLIARNFITLPRFDQSKPTFSRMQIELDTRLLAILFSFGIPEVVSLLPIIQKLLADGMEFGQWRCIVNSYTPENYSLAVREEADFRNRVNQLLINKLINFRKAGLISPIEENFFIDKLK